MTWPLEYGWWTRKRGQSQVPPYVEDPRNYTLTLAELKEYQQVLAFLRKVVDAEAAAVNHNVRCVEAGRIPFATYEDPPRCTTLCDMLEFQVANAKAKLYLMQFLLRTSGERVDVVRHANDLTRWEAEGGKLATAARRATGGVQTRA
jgi:hypothetical protein